LFALFIYGVSTGTPNLLMTPYDSNNPRRQCGIDSEVKDYPYLYFTTPFPGLLNHTVCVKECPTVYSLYPNGTKYSGSYVLDCATTSTVSSC